jgi:spermidine synthase
MYATYLGLFFISAGTLILEISLTRVFSISQWGNFAFLVISTALLGFGASGTFVAVYPSLLKANKDKVLSISSYLCSLSCIVSYVVANRIPFDHFRTIVDQMQLLYVFVIYLALSVPFFLAGLPITIILALSPEDASRSYSFNLAGAGAGCIIAVAVAGAISGPGLIALSSLLGFVAALFFSWNYSRRLIVSAVAIPLYLLLAFRPPPFLGIRITPYKDLPTFLRYPGTEVAFTGWNSISRVDVLRSPLVRHAPGLSLSFQKALPPQMGLVIDGGGLTALTRFSGGPEETDFTRYLISALPYRLHRSPKVLVIGPGGGLEVLTALGHDSRSVVGVEVNPMVVRVIKDLYGDFVGGIYSLDRVRIAIGDGRSFMRREGSLYDMIQIPLTESQIASSVGAYSLNENYLYTVEAFQDYWRHLSPNGVLSITRPLGLPPQDTLRLTALALRALRGVGIEKPEKNIALIRSWGAFTFLLKRSLLTADEIEKIKGFAKDLGFDLIYYPGMNPEEADIYNRLDRPYFYQTVVELIADQDRYHRLYLLDIRPPTDDRPFFNHYLKWTKIVELYGTLGRRIEPFALSGDVILIVILVQSLMAGFVIVLMPLFLREELRGDFILARTLFYFTSLGLGFMFIEMALIGKFILFLGHPVYALSAVLFSVLSFSGAGSILSRRLREGQVGYLMIAIFGMGSAYGLGISFLLHLFLGAHIALRVILSVLLLAPLSIAMGMPLPLGVRILGKMKPGLVPVAWGVNSWASVVGPVLATMAAIYLGFGMVMILAALIYVVGFIAFLPFLPGRPSARRGLLRRSW